MNIALCHESVLPRRGGCETYIASLTRRLVADGHSVHLYAWRWDAEALPGSVHYHPIALPRRPRFLRPWLFSRACQAMLGRGRHDISVGFDKIAGVDVYYPQGGVHAQGVIQSLSKHRGVVVRGLLRGLRWLDPAQLSFAALEQAQFRRPNSVIVAISDLVRQQLARVAGLPMSRVAHLPIAAPPERLAQDGREESRQRFREKWDLRTGRTVALFAGMNYRLKGLVPLLHALAQVRKVPVDLVVAGLPSAGEFRRLALRLGILDRVRFVGYCGEMRDAYFGSDLLVHPTFYDPCANVVLEALACGLPIITSRHNGASELLRAVGEPGECAEGYIVDDPHDTRRLAECLELLADPARRVRCAEAARQAGARWTFEDHYHGLVGILERAAGMKPVPAQSGSMLLSCSR